MMVSWVEISKILLAYIVLLPLLVSKVLDNFNADFLFRALGTGSLRVIFFAYSICNRI